MCGYLEMGMTVLMVGAWTWVWALAWWYWRGDDSKREKEMEGPRAWPLLGCAIEHMLNYERMHDWLLEYLSKSSTRTVRVRMPFTDYTYTADPANVEHILKTNFTNYPKGKTYRRYMRELLGDGIFNVDGDMWRTQRKTASLEFASRNLKDFSTQVFRHHALVLSRILSRISVQNLQHVDIHDLFMRMTLDSICKVGFGVDISTLHLQLPHNPFAVAFDTANSIVTLRFIDPLWRLKSLLRIGSESLLRRSISVVDDFIYSVINTRKAHLLSNSSPSESLQTQTTKADLLTRFMELRKNPGSNLTDKNLRDIVLNFVIAGRDTTASTLSWFVYMMIIHPDIADTIHEDLCEFEREEGKGTGTDTHTATEDMDRRMDHFAGLVRYETMAHPRLGMLHAAITETLRLYPPVPQDPKGILSDDFLPDGTKVKKGGMVTYVPYSMGRLQHLWGPDASQFNPRRWLNQDLHHVSPFKFTAFQAGPRICLGKDSAYLQLKITTAILCRFFRFHLVPGHPVRYRMMTILSMAHGLKVTISPRI